MEEHIQVTLAICAPALDSILTEMYQSAAQGSRLAEQVKSCIAFAEASFEASFKQFDEEMASLEEEHAQDLKEQLQAADDDAAANDRLFKASIVEANREICLLKQSAHEETQALEGTIGQLRAMVTADTEEAACKARVARQINEQVLVTSKQQQQKAAAAEGVSERLALSKQLEDAHEELASTTNENEMLVAGILQLEQSVAALELQAQGMTERQGEAAELCFESAELKQQIELLEAHSIKQRLSAQVALREGAEAVRTELTQKGALEQDRLKSQIRALEAQVDELDTEKRTLLTELAEANTSAALIESAGRRQAAGEGAAAVSRRLPARSTEQPSAGGWRFEERGVRVSVRLLESVAELAAECVWGALSLMERELHSKTDELTAKDLAAAAWTQLDIAGRQLRALMAATVQLRGQVKVLESQTDQCSCAVPPLMEAPTPPSAASAFTTPQHNGAAEGAVVMTPQRQQFFNEGIALARAREETEDQLLIPGSNQAAAELLAAELAAAAQAAEDEDEDAAARSPRSASQAQEDTEGVARLAAAAKATEDEEEAAVAASEADEEEMRKVPSDISTKEGALFRDVLEELNVESTQGVLQAPHRAVELLLSQEATSGTLSEKLSQLDERLAVGQGQLQMLPRGKERTQLKAQIKQLDRQRRHLLMQAQLKETASPAPNN